MSRTHLALSCPAATVISVVCGGFHTCALMQGGGVKCWGWNDYWELGIGSNVQQDSPVDLNLGCEPDVHTEHIICMWISPYASVCHVCNCACLMVMYSLVTIY